MHDFSFILLDSVIFKMKGKAEPMEQHMIVLLQYVRSYVMNMKMMTFGAASKVKNIL